jgi:hypothetical protein
MPNVTDIARKTRRIAVAIVLTGFAVMGLGLSAGASARSVNVVALYTSRVSTDGCASPVGLCLVGDFHGTLNGTGSLSVNSFGPTPAPNISVVDADVVIHDTRGDLRCREDAVLNTAAGSDSEYGFVCELTGGTGHWAGATGYLASYGSVPPGDTENHGTLAGRIVLPS